MKTLKIHRIRIAMISLLIFSHCPIWGQNWLTAGNALVMTGILGSTNNNPVQFVAFGTQTAWMDNTNFRMGIGPLWGIGTPPNFMLDVAETTMGLGVNVGCSSCATANAVGYGIGDSIILWHNGILSSLFAGVHAGGTSPSGSANTYIGNLTGYYNNGGNNTCIGYAAGYGPGATTTYNYNTFIGSQAGYATTTGFQNTAIGMNALGRNTTGEKNVAVGYGALQNTFGDQNTGVGLCGSTNRAGTENTFLGWGADAAHGNLTVAKEVTIINENAIIYTAINAIKQLDSTNTAFTGSNGAYKNSTNAIEWGTNNLTHNTVLPMNNYNALYEDQSSPTTGFNDIGIGIPSSYSTSTALGAKLDVRTTTEPDIISAQWTGGNPSSAINGVYSSVLTQLGVGGVFNGGQTGLTANCNGTYSASTNTGIVASASGNTINYGVNASAINTSSSTATMYGIKSSGTGTGLSSTAYGVYGTASGANTNYAVYGDALGNTKPAYWARYFNGDLNVTGTTYHISDSILKSNITTLTNPMAMVKKLNPVS